MNDELIPTKRRIGLVVLTKDLRAMPACSSPNGCHCGGDTQKIRAGCGHYINSFAPHLAADRLDIVKAFLQDVDVRRFAIFSSSPVAKRIAAAALLLEGFENE